MTKSGRPRVAVVMPPLAPLDPGRPNSIETVVRTLYRAAPDAAEVLFICDAGAADHGGLPVQTVSPDRGRVEAVIRAVRAYQPDLIECHQQVQQGSRIAAAFPDVPSLLYRHNDLKPPRGPLDRWRYGRRLGRFDALTFVSVASREAFQRDYPNLADRAWAVRNPIDADLWRASPDKRERLIVFSGRAIAEKGLDRVCEALPVVLRARPGWRAALFLNDWASHAGWAAPHVAALETSGLPVVVRRDAPLAEVRAAVQAAAIALTPSVWPEPLGLTALEAHAAGAALISSGRGGLREVSGPHALYVDPPTAAGLVDAMLALIDDPERRLALARAGQAHVVAEHSPERRAADLARLRAQVIRRKSDA